MWFLNVKLCLYCFRCRTNYIVSNEKYSTLNGIERMMFALKKLECQIENKIK